MYFKRAKYCLEIGDSNGLDNYAKDLASKVEGIGTTLREIFVRSDAENIPTFVIADRVAEERFSKAEKIYLPDPVSA